MQETAMMSHHVINHLCQGRFVSASVYLSVGKIVQKLPDDFSRNFYEEESRYKQLDVGDVDADPRIFFRCFNVAAMPACMKWNQPL